MAKCNEINVGRFNRALQKSLQLKGGRASAQLAREVMPILAFFRGAEDRSLESWYRFASWAQCVATVAAHGVAQLRNPKTSGAIVVVERISFNNQTNADLITLSIGTNDTDLLANSALALLDIRSQRRAGASAKSTNQSNATGIPIEFAFAAVGILLNHESSFITTENQEIDAAPGDELKVFRTTTTTPLNIHFIRLKPHLDDTEAPLCT